MADTAETVETLRRENIEPRARLGDLGSEWTDDVYIAQSHCVSGICAVWNAFWDWLLDGGVDSPCPVDSAQTAPNSTQTDANLAWAGDDEYDLVL